MMYCVRNNKRYPPKRNEAAARLREADGSRCLDYPWGNSDVDCARAVLDLGGCGSDEPQSVGTAGSFAYGVADLTGNVREWVFDRYQADTYENNLQDRGARQTTMPTCPRPSFEEAALPPAPVLSRAATGRPLVNGFATDLG